MLHFPSNTQEPSRDFKRLKFKENRDENAQDRSEENETEEKLTSNSSKNQTFKNLDNLLDPVKLSSKPHLNLSYTKRRDSFSKIDLDKSRTNEKECSIIHYFSQKKPIQFKSPTKIRFKGN